MNTHAIALVTCIVETLAVLIAVIALLLQAVASCQSCTSISIDPISSQKFAKDMAEAFQQSLKETPPQQLPRSNLALTPKSSSIYDYPNQIDPISSQKLAKDMAEAFQQSLKETPPQQLPRSNLALTPKSSSIYDDPNQQAITSTLYPSEEIMNNDNSNYTNNLNDKKPIDYDNFITLI